MSDATWHERRLGVPQEIATCTACGGVAQGDTRTHPGGLTADLIRYCLTCRALTQFEWKPVTAVTALPGTRPGVP